MHCLYYKRTPEYHQRDVTGNCWKEVVNKAGLENGKIPFVLFQTLHYKITRNHRANTITMLQTICSLVLDLVAKKKLENVRKRYKKAKIKIFKKIRYLDKKIRRNSW